MGLSSYCAVWLPGCQESSFRRLQAELKGGKDMKISKLFTVLLMIIVLIIPSNAAFAIQSSSQVKNQQYSTWLWDTNQIATNPDKILNFLSQNNVKNLYLQIDYNLKPDIYRSFIRKASSKNISVHALEGAPDWVSSDGITKQKKFFDWLAYYQKIAAINERFRGVHLDIEPYLSPEYNADMNKVIENYQSILLNSLDKSNSLKLSLGIDIPFWFDEVSYSTKYGSGSLAEWITKNIKNIVIMAYRDNATGDNGIINLVSKEMGLGKQYNTTITIAVETQKCAEGSYISFYEEGTNYMNSELEKVYINYKNNSNFGGFAIHDVVNWMKLKK